MRPELVPKSRALARVLRHRPEIWGVRLDREGWCQVDALLAGAASHGQALSLAELHEIVDANDKQRFGVSPDGRRIRAVQGHSVSVDLKLPTRTPPPVLYHGTVRKHLPAIRREGLLPMNRHAVHLSTTKDAAEAVGRRRGAPVVLVVDSYAMHRAGLKFQQAENGIWLTAAVPAKFLNSSRPLAAPTSLPTGNHIPQDFQSQLMHQAAVELIAADPMLVSRAKATLARWMAKGDPRTSPLWAQWRQILDQQNWTRALEDSEVGRQLRQASPLSTLLPQARRLEIIREVSSLKAQTRSEHRLTAEASPIKRGTVLASLLPEEVATPPLSSRRSSVGKKRG
ncbi:RNA 2'-phosphotransferase [Variovorax saccharolyticus]|uniref:RNA 2'-phosphotransferase n=1 Tax=Variovorax saccharolyticus TaxID=3053516 RepID=UPI002577D840|nr:RNA 2'-phosphotransferase [Variovorax sp. J22R187]MDM0018033.1 RNA 2'-phosphotransferase [Variovorax sp. J22R187]